MQYSQLGRTGATVSRLVLGTMNFGPHTAEDDAFAIMDRALEQGVTFVDTANVYGGKEHRGWTEEIVGRWLARTGKRDEIVLATKVFGEMGPGANDRGLSALNIRRAVDESLRRLQTDHIDLYQMHHVDRSAPWEEIWQAMDLLVAQGKISYVGSSNFAGWHLAQANETARARRSLGLVSEQSLYNLFSRDVELEVLPAAEHYGMGVIAWSPLSGGKLGGRSEGGVRRGTADRRHDPADLTDQLDRWEAFCDERGLAPGQAALAWLLHRPGVLGPIIGPRTMEQLDSAIEAVDISLSDEDLATLDEIFPGPGGPAPEAYAW
ncbi:aldo/keto reductase [Brachybacterium alimentarium]|uniref:aldo/keto reductase n=1 Tax=Brachybacterium alimentarium TaxID=47845 RepID=UPI000DF2CEBC|nr:aldo/keto reductase [Brachybacterium alimentarium]RCS60643.1 aldo/keto reductase [Brachybacterium alimentarium]RCS80221.1 aldo/keto reductase [Brachybacterium alimentarium]RCS88353.1 aldo/keto reductase [Brachybacterium alimentarium]